ncbi:hypothetical protein AYO40_05270 [Planctomycetaceae bacterium SCGC AG-212-D15]|nr:hypothetical protein AYO40_05270 [Planctomycetaceae bacterium SCGC AG-212-D15]
MSLELYNPYSMQDAMALFPGKATTHSLDNSQVAVSRSQALFFSTLGSPERGAYFPGPGQFCYRPIPPRKGKKGREWLPDDLRNARGKTTQHLLARKNSKDSYVYVGVLRMTRLFDANDGVSHRVDFELTPKLPRETWIDFGGIPFVLNAYSFTETNRRHAENLELRTLADLHKALEKYRSKERAALYLNPDGGDSGCLWVHLTGDRAWLTHFTELGGVDSYAKDADYTGPDEMVGFLLDNGQKDDIHRGWTVSRDEAFKALEYFFRQGERDPSLTWVEQPGSLQACP